MKESVNERKAAPELGESMMLVLFDSWKRVRLSEGFPVHGGDLVWEIIRRHRLRSDLAPGFGDLDSRLCGKDLHRYIPDVDEIPNIHRTAQSISASLNEAAWRAGRGNDKTTHTADMWAPDVRTLLSLAFMNAGGRDDTVVSGYHCMNVAFAVEMLTPREPPVDKPLRAPIVVPMPYPWVPFVVMAKLFGVVEWKKPRVVIGAFSGLGRLSRRDIRRFGMVAYLLQRESIRQAVRNGDDMVTPAHVLVAIVSAASQLRLAEAAATERHQAALGAGYALLDRGIDVLNLSEVALVSSFPGFSEDAYKGRLWQSAPGDPAVSVAASAIFEAAAERASAQGRRHLGEADLIFAIAHGDDRVSRTLREQVDLAPWA